MNRLHLIWQIFHWLHVNRPTILDELSQGLPDTKWNPKAESTIRDTFNHALAEFRKNPSGEIK